MTHGFGFTMRMAVVCLLAALLTGLGSCKKEKADVSDLLSTVPSSAGAVVGINLGSVLEKAGCKVDGSGITAGPELEKWIESQKEYAGSQKEAMKLFFSGESGVDPAGAIFFVDAYSSYITAMLADTPKFTAFVEKQSGKTFEETDGVKVCGNVAVIGAQTWICLSSQDAIDARAVRNYATLQESQSFMSCGFAPEIAGMDKDLVGWGKIQAFTGHGMSISDIATLNMLTGILFEDATAVSFSCDFLKGRFEGKVSPLNDKGEPAKYLLPADKVDLGLVKKLASTAEFVGAMSITKDFMKKIEKISSSLGGNMFGPVVKTLACLDGTVAVALSDIDNPGAGISGVVSTDGNPSLDFMSMLSRMAPTRKDGKLVYLKNGEVKGALDVDKAADFLKGATFGIVVNAGTQSLGAPVEGIKTIAMSLVPDGGSLTMDLAVESTNPDENIIVTLLRK